MSDQFAIKAAVDSDIAAAAQLALRGEFEEAFARYREVASVRPDRFEGPLGMAHCMFAVGDMVGALQLLPRALELEPTCMDAYQMLFALGVHGGVADKAIYYLEYGAQGMPQEAQLFEWLIVLYAIDGRIMDLKQAVNHYGRLRGKAPHDVVLMFSRDATLPEDVRSRIADALY